MIKKVSLKKILLFLCVGLLIFGVAIAYAAQDWDEIIKKAKEEGVVYTYGTSGRMSNVGELLAREYGIELKHVKMSDQEIIERIIREQDAGVCEVDFIRAEDMIGVAKRLLPGGYVENFIPDMFIDKIPEKSRNPLVLFYAPRIIVYNIEAYNESPINNLWELTTEKWKGKVFLRDPAITSTTVNFFAEIVAHPEQMARAYKDLFGEEIELTTPNAGWEFIKMLANNSVITTSSDSDVAKAIGTPGQEKPPIGLVVGSKLRYNRQKGYVLGVAVDVKPVTGYLFPSFGLQVANAPHPNAAKLLARILLTDEGAHAFTQDEGTFSVISSNSCNPNDALGGLNEWKKVTWDLNLENVLKYSKDVIDFWILNRN